MIELDKTKKRLIFRAWHRGMREMDLVLGRYIDQNIAMMTQTQLNEFERILEFDDRDLIGWLCGQACVPAEIDSPLLRDIMNFPAR